VNRTALTLAVCVASVIWGLNLRTKDTCLLKDASLYQSVCHFQLVAICQVFNL